MAPFGSTAIILQWVRWESELATAHSRTASILRSSLKLTPSPAPTSSTVPPMPLSANTSSCTYSVACGFLRCAWRCSANCHCSEARRPCAWRSCGPRTGLRGALAPLRTTGACKLMAGQTRRPNSASRAARDTASTSSANAHAASTPSTSHTSAGSSSTARGIPNAMSTDTTSASCAIRLRVRFFINYFQPRANPANGATAARTGRVRHRRRRHGRCAVWWCEAEVSRRVADAAASGAARAEAGQQPLLRHTASASDMPRCARHVNGGRQSRS